MQFQNFPNLGKGTPFQVYNPSLTETIPACALMELGDDAGTLDPEYNGYAQVFVPSLDNEKKIVVNGPNAILPQSAGTGYFELTGVLNYDSQDGIPNPADPMEEWGAKKGEFLARKGYKGFKAAATDPTGFFRYFRTFTDLGSGSLSIPIAYCDANGELAYFYICLRGVFSWTVGSCDLSSSSGSHS